MVGPANDLQVEGQELNFFKIGIGFSDREKRFH